MKSVEVVQVKQVSHAFASLWAPLPRNSQYTMHFMESKSSYTIIMYQIPVTEGLWDT
jgi:hypothetical protein